MQLSLGRFSILVVCISFQLVLNGIQFVQAQNGFQLAERYCLQFAEGRWLYLCDRNTTTLNTYCMITTQSVVGVSASIEFCKAISTQDRLSCFAYAMDPTLDSEAFEGPSERELRENSWTKPKTIVSGLKGTEVLDLCRGSESVWPARCYYLARNLFPNKQQAISFCTGADNIAKPGCMIRMFRDYYNQFLWFSSDNGTAVSITKRQVNANPSPANQTFTDPLLEAQCRARSVKCIPKPSISDAYHRCKPVTVPADPQWLPITIQTVLDSWVHQASFDMNFYEPKWEGFAKPPPGSVPERSPNPVPPPTDPNCKPIFQVVNVQDYLNVRSCGGTNCDVVLTVGYGAQLLSMSNSLTNGFRQIQTFDGLLSGWVSNSYLQNTNNYKCPSVATSPLPKSSVAAVDWWFLYRTPKVVADLSNVTPLGSSPTPSAAGPTARTLARRQMKREYVKRQVVAPYAGVIDGTAYSYALGETFDGNLTFYSFAGFCPFDGPPRDLEWSFFGSPQQQAIPSCPFPNKLGDHSFTDNPQATWTLPTQIPMFGMASAAVPSTSGNLKPCQCDCVCLSGLKDCSCVDPEKKLESYQQSIEKCQCRCNNDGSTCNCLNERLAVTDPSTLSAFLPTPTPAAPAIPSNSSDEDTDGPLLPDANNTIPDSPNWFAEQTLVALASRSSSFLTYAHNTTVNNVTLSNGTKLSVEGVIRNDCDSLDYFSKKVESNTDYLRRRVDSFRTKLRQMGPIESFYSSNANNLTALSAPLADARTERMVRMKVINQMIWTNQLANEAYNAELSEKQISKLLSEIDQMKQSLAVLQARQTRSLWQRFENLETRMSLARTEIIGPLLRKIGQRDETIEKQWSTLTKSASDLGSGYTSIQGDLDSVASMVIDEGSQGYFGQVSEAVKALQTKAGISDFRP